MSTRKKKVQSFNRLLLTVLLKALGTLTRGESDRAGPLTAASILFWAGPSMNFVNPFIQSHIDIPKVLFKDLNPGIAMAIVRFKFSRKLYFCFESVIRQKFNFSAFSEMAQNFWFWLHWMKRNYVFVLVDDKVSKFKSIQNWNWKFLLNFLEIAIKVIHFMYYLI